MATEEVTSKLKSVQLNNFRDINILLLGETGVGKSTFINAIANYLHFKEFKEAKKNDLLILIPATITVTDKNYQSKTVTIGNDNNEFKEVGASATQNVKTYVFPLGDGKTRIRLIDTPGMADTRGVKQDDENCEYILNYLGQLRELHAICFLMSPTNTRLTVSFEYCVKQILSRLEKTASRNLLFVFTNSRGTNYTPGETLPLLTKVIEDIKNSPPNVEIPLSNRNLYSLDNEAFRYLVALKNNVEFDKQAKLRCKESWKKSAEECSRLITYIIGDSSNDPLKPHQIQNTVSINEARRMINQLARPLADVSQLIDDNLRILDRHSRNLLMENASLEEMKKKLYIPVINLNVTNLPKPVTVCASAKCAETLQVGERKKYHYKQRCHDPCYLTDIPKELVGHPGLVNCAAMSNKMCKICGCYFSVHMHIYYMTTPVDDRIEDEVVRDNITRKEEALLESRRLMGEIQKRKKELEDEREEVIKTTALFAHFLQHNAITPFNDSYAAYINYLIIREESLGPQTDPEIIQDLGNMLKQYEATKEAFDTSLKINQQFGLRGITDNAVNANTVLSSVYKLYKLKHNGGKIKQLIDSQKNSRKFEHGKTCEYIHSKSGALTSDSDKRSKDQKDGKKDKPQAKKWEKRNTQFPHQKNPTKPQQNQYRTPPPPYPGHEEYKSKEKKEEIPNLFSVKVEVQQPRNERRNSRTEDGFQGPRNDSYYPQASQNQYYGPQGHHYGPPGPNYVPPGPNYVPPSPGPGPYGPGYAPTYAPNYGYNHGPAYGHGPNYGPPGPSYGPNWGPNYNHHSGPGPHGPAPPYHQSRNQNYTRNPNNQNRGRNEKFQNQRGGKVKQNANRHRSQSKSKAQKESTSDSSE